MTAKQWREANPDLKGNIRDYATINELICLSNMENINAVLINDGIPQGERLVKLNQIAIQQMQVLEDNGGRNGGEGDGTTVVIEDTKITTTGNGSGGIMTTGGGVTKAKNLTVNTSGRSSAPIRTDRGGGVVTIEGGSYTSNGQGSPVIYSTADVTISDAVLTSTMSEGAVIEGKNSITLNNCQMTVSNTRRNSNAQFLDGIMIYQSFSGDAASGNSHFTMNGGTLTNRQGHIIHVTNTNAIITLNSVTLVNDAPAKVLLSVCADDYIIHRRCLVHQTQRSSPVGKR